MSYRYMRPATVEAALEMLTEYQATAVPVAGGTNFMPDFRSGKQRPQVVIDISRLPLRYIDIKEDRVRIGALTTVTDLRRKLELAEAAPVLYKAAETFAGYLVRNRATVAGNLVDASPAADLVPPLLALGAEVTLVSPAGTRTVPIAEFTLGVRKTDRRPDELVTEISFPKVSASARSSYFKFALREAMAISVVSGAIILEFNGETCSAARIALGAVAPKPVRAKAVEAALVGRRITEAEAEAAAAQVAADISPITDVRATAEYRTWVTEALVARHLLTAAGVGA